VPSGAVCRLAPEQKHHNDDDDDEKDDSSAYVHAVPPRLMSVAGTGILLAF